MLETVYRLGCELIAKTKMAQLCQRLAYPDKVTILMYHGILKESLTVEDWCFLDELSFRKQIKYLREHFEIITLSDAVERMRNGGIRRPSAVITFDDGYQNNFDVAFPILRTEGIPATIFLATGLLNSRDTVWYCRLNLAFSQTHKDSIEWNGSKFDLSTSSQKGRASAVIQDSLKRLGHPELMATVRSIILELGGDPDCPIEIGSPFRMLDKEAVGAMATSGLIEFGAHTHHHAILRFLSKEERLNEIRQSIHAIKEVTGRACRYFAYPNGRTEDYDFEIIQDLKACGVQMAVTTISGPNDRMTPLMELRRYGIGAGLPMAEFQVMVHHFVNKILG